jgi:hypothetical protein
MMEEKKIFKAYRDEFYPPIPTKGTKYWRTNLVYQFFRFAKLNFKIMRMVVKGHS